jgi:hypothetical protein
MVLDLAGMVERRLIVLEYIGERGTPSGGKLGENRWLKSLVTAREI